ncbi:MAG TPA: CHASE3 domain-containing protein [Candidatus Saccharimonadales bacterium]|jgi:signal transduction histidine kinase
MFRIRKLQTVIPLCIALLIGLVGILVEVGWAIDSQYLKSVLPNMLSMNPVTAVGFMIAGVALAALVKHKYQVALVSGFVIATIGFLKLAALLSGWDIPVDQWLFTDKLVNNGNFLPSRIAPNTALNFFIAGCGLMLLARPTSHRVHLAQYLSFTSLFLAFLALNGYLYGVKSLYGVGTFIPMALHTTICFMLLASSMLLLRAEEGIMGTLFFGKSSSGKHSRLSIVIGFLILPVLFIAVSLITLHGTKVFIKTRTEVDTTYNVILAANRTLAALGDAETGQRGYLLTGKERYLQPYTNARVAVSRNIDTLEKLAPEMQQSIATIRILSDQKFAELNSTIQLRRAGQPQAALEIVLSDEGKNTMDALRVNLASLENIKMSELNNGKIKEKVAESETTLALAAGTILTMILIIAVGILLLRSYRLNAYEKQNIESEVRRRTDELNAEHARLTASIESLTFGFVIVTKDLHIKALNTSATKLLGLTGKHSFDAVVHALGSTVPLRERVNQVILSGKTTEIYDVNLQNKVLVIAISPVAHDGNIDGAVVTLADVTEQRVMDRSRDEFFSIASHELRTPLTAIRGTTSMILDMYGDKLPDSSLKEMIHDMHEASVRLISTVNNFLDTSTLEQGKHMFAIEKVQLSTLVPRSVALAASIKHAEVETNVQVDNLPLVLADKTALGQVVDVLLSNAYKFTDAGVVTIRGKRKDGTVQLIISDTGKGVAADKQFLLFRKFQQASDNILTRDVTHSVGLGLYNARLLCEGMGCTIDLQSSKIGEGSSFVITLPIAD